VIDRYAVKDLTGDAEERRHFLVQEALARPVWLNPLTIEHELGDRALADVLEHFVRGSRDLLDVDLFVGDIVLGKKTLRFTAVAAPGGCVNGQIHTVSLREVGVGIQWERQENTMPQTRNVRAQELHNLASQAHARAATSHEQNDHLTAHELSKQAFEHSREAHEHSEKLLKEAAAEQTK
jgi:hypothetical protein